MVAACFHGAREGLLSLVWDIICPLCRIPSQTQDSLKQLKEHGNCQACQTDFELDFANSIELVFKIAPEIKDCETGIYCVGGPAHSPHVVAQVRLKPGEKFSCDLNLGEGLYRVRGPQLAYSVEFRVRADSGVSRWELDLSRGPTAETPRVVQAGSQFFVLTNDEGHELVARLERVASRADALTAARAASTPLFRELFPGECLSGNQLIRVEQITLLLTRLDRAQQLYFELGDARAFERVHEHFQQLNQIVQREGGSLIKTLTEGIEAVFHEPLGAVRAGLAMRELGESGLSIAIHRGPAMVATLNDHLDYFGATVSTAEQLLAMTSQRACEDLRGIGFQPVEFARKHDRLEAYPTKSSQPQRDSAAQLVVSNSIAMDEAVAETIAARQLAFRIEQPLSSAPQVWPHRVQPSGG